MGAAETGLRERKKEKTRHAIYEAALGLFLERGFEETTIADIADAADVSPRTFFSYFPAKEDVVFASWHDRDMPALRAHLEARPPGASAIEALREFLESAMEEIGPDMQEELRRCKLIAESPALSAYETARIRPEFEQLICEEVARDLGVDPNGLGVAELGPRMVAAAAAVAFFPSADAQAAAALAAEENPDAYQDAIEPTEVVEGAIRFMRGGLAALGEAD